MFYYHHPESDALWCQDYPMDYTESDGLVEEVSQEGAYAVAVKSGIDFIPEIKKPLIFYVSAFVSIKTMKTGIGIISNLSSPDIEHVMKVLGFTQFEDNTWYAVLQGSVQSKAELVGAGAAMKAIVKYGRGTVVSHDQYPTKCMTVWGEKWQKNGWLNKQKEPVRNRPHIAHYMELYKMFEEEINLKTYCGEIEIMQANEVAQIAAQGRVKA